VSQSTRLSVYFGMNTPTAPSLFPNAESNTSHSRTHINTCLWFDECAGYRVVWCRHEILYRTALDDGYHLRLIAVMLRQSELATQLEISAAFGHSVAAQRRWETRYRLQGAVGLQAKTPTGRPPELDHSQCAFVKVWFEQGISNLEMARRLAVSEATIRRVLSQAGLRRQRQSAAELPLDLAGQTPAAIVAPPAEPAPAVAGASVPVTLVAVSADELRSQVTAADADSTTTRPSAEAAAVVASVVPAANVAARVLTIDRDPTDRSGDRSMARLGLLDDASPLFGNQEELSRAGVLLVVPVLQAHGALEVFARLFGSIGPAFYGLRTTVLSLILLALLRIKRPENVKEYSPEALGRLLGLDRMAEVKTLRRKLTLLAERGQGHALMTELARLRLAQDEDRVAFLYLDGHVREYSGKEPLAKTKKAQRSVATPAATDTWLNDADGAPLLVVTSEMNAGLTQVLEPIVREAKALVPAGQRLTVLFDRGGWSARLFARLDALGVDIITYRKGKHQPVSRSSFAAHRVQENGREKTYWLYDQPRVRVGRLRPHRRGRRSVGEPEYLWLRQITVLRDDGRQTVIVTNRADLTAVEVIQRLFRRWRQENYFKYMDAEFALDALVEYGAEDVSAKATRPNPERKPVARKRQQAQAEVARLHAELGAEVTANQEQQRPTMRGFKVAQASLRQRLEQAELCEQALAEQLRQLPERVSAKGLKTLKKEKKLIVDAIKIIAYQCETALLDRLHQHYARADDEGRTLLHAAFQSSARFEVTETELKITLATQSSPHRSEALAKLCDELDAELACYPGSSLRIRMAVAGQEPLTESES
jgi:transposase-like protein